MNRRAWLTFIAAQLLVSSSWALTPPRLSREDAAKHAQKQVGGGKVLGIKLRNSESDPPYFDVKLLTNGKVQVLRIDAQ